MSFYDLKETKQLLKKEFPKLNFDIVKQFKSYGVENRIYNTFLVRDIDSSKPVIAKGNKLSTEALLLEWEILKKLNNGKMNAPRVLYPKHKPKHFILMEYIDAKNADEYLKDNPKDIRVFSLIGDCLGEFHKTKAKWFGNLLTRERYSNDWVKLMHEKTDGRVKGLRNHLGISFFTKITKYYESIRNDFINDNIKRPILIHRDIYLDNFLIKDKAILIDYGMVYGGRPWYDLGKFYVSDLYEHPGAKDIFLDSYKKHIKIPENYILLLKYYTFTELAGMIHHAKSHGKKIYYNKVLKIFNELINDKGVISELLK
jgi:fructosamine-3-kinase